jgi:hypothetical protein
MIRSAKYMLVFLVVGAGYASAQSFESGSDGSDGALFVPADTELIIDLGNALTGPWDTEIPLEAAGDGIYDSDNWAVVFKYTTIDIELGATVRFINHPKNPPVVWLAEGSVTIDGEVNLDGGDGADVLAGGYAIPGPGGFEGGTGSFNGIFASAGFGPGGGGVGDGGGFGQMGEGSNGGDSYGSDGMIPIIGGSDGGGRPNTTSRGGAGGGSILIGSSGEIAFGQFAELSVRGGNPSANTSNSGAGSGGGIRLVANEILSSGGDIFAFGGTTGDDGGHGRIRLEATDIAFAGSIGPTAEISFAPSPIFSDLVPTLEATVVDDIPVPTDPDAGIRTTDLEIENPNDVVIEIAATNIPIGTTVTVIVIPAHGERFEVDSDPLSGTFESSGTTAMVSIPPGRVEIQLRANWTP